MSLISDSLKKAQKLRNKSGGDAKSDNVIADSILNSFTAIFVKDLLQNFVPAHN